MSGVKNLKDPQFLPNSRYEIKTSEGFKSFGGLIFGESDELYSYEGIIYTAEHLINIGIGGEFVEVKTIGEKVEGTKMMFDPFDVEGDHTYLTYDGKEHHNCQTGEQLIDIYDKVSNSYLKVSFKELESMIKLDNAGIDYKDM